MAHAHAKGQLQTTLDLKVRVETNGYSTDGRTNEGRMQIILPASLITVVGK